MVVLMLLGVLVREGRKERVEEKEGEVMERAVEMGGEERSSLPLATSGSHCGGVARDKTVYFILILLETRKKKKQKEKRNKEKKKKNKRSKRG